MVQISTVRRAWPQVILLLLVSPVFAEYLSAYDESTGHPALLLGNLILFIPLYGCGAVLIREVARRAGLGWRGIVLLAAAYGVWQAGLVDQSLFSPDYRGLPGWDEMFGATLIEPLGVSGYNLLLFVGGHIVGSIAGPIALAEGVRPSRAQQPWLGRVGLAVVALGWLGGSALVYQWHLDTESWHAAPAQLVGAGVSILLLVVAAFSLGRRPRAVDPRPAPSLPVVGAVLVPIGLLWAGAIQNWLGVAMMVTAATLGTLVLTRWSTRAGWSPTHAALAGAVIPGYTAALAFGYDPMIGQVTQAAKYAHNAVMLLIVLGLVAVVLLRRTPRPVTRTDRSGPVSRPVS